MKMDVAIVSHSAFLTAVHLEKGVPRNAIISCAKKCYEMPPTTSSSDPLALPTCHLVVLGNEHGRLGGFLVLAQGQIHGKQMLGLTWSPTRLPQQKLLQLLCQRLLTGLTDLGSEEMRRKYRGTPKVVSLRT